MKLRFSIRDLLWLTLLAAVLVAWFLDRSGLKAELDDWNQHGTKLKLTHGPGLVVEEQHDDVMRYLESLRDTK